MRSISSCEEVQSNGEEVKSNVEELTSSCDEVKSNVEELISSCEEVKSNVEEAISSCVRSNPNGEEAISSERARPGSLRRPLGLSRAGGPTCFARPASLILTASASANEGAG